jgi:hypothetical protein
MSERQQRMTRGAELAVTGAAVITGVAWGPALQAPWYSFFAAAGLALALGFTVALAARAAGLRAGVAAGTAVLAVIIANATVLVWGMSHSQ